MKRGIKFGILALVIILGTFLVLAGSGNLAPSTAEAGDNVSMLWFNVSAVNNSGNLTSVTINNTGTATGYNITSVTVSNGTVYYNNSFGSFPGAGVIVYIGAINNTTDTTGVNFTINFTLNSSAKWNKTIQANISGNSSEINITFPTIGTLNSTAVTINESTSPVPSASCSPSEVYEGESFPCTCTATDSQTNASGVSTTRGSSTAPEGTGTPETAGTFTYTCSATDYAGNSASSSTTYTVLDVGGTTTSGGTSSFWTSTHSVTEEQFAEGFTRQRKEGERFKLTINNENHYVGVKIISGDTVTIEVSSDPQEANLAVGDSKKFDIDDDGYYDILVTLNEIVDGSADLTVKSISEEITEEEGGGIGPKLPFGGEGRNLTWLWVLIVLVILALIIGGGRALKRKQ